MPRAGLRAPRRWAALPCCQAPACRDGAARPPCCSLPDQQPCPAPLRLVTRWQSHHPSPSISRRCRGLPPHAAPQGIALSCRGPSWPMAGSGRGNVPVRAMCLPSVPPGPLMAPLLLTGVPGRGRELGMRTARRRRGVPSPTGWRRGRDEPVSVPLSSPLAEVALMAPEGPWR